MENRLLPTPTTESLLNATNTWHNLTHWAVNVTRYAPFLEDIVKAGPRVLMKLGSLISPPEQGDLNNDHFADSDLFATNPPDESLHNIMESVSSLGQDIAGSGPSPSAATPRRLSLESAKGLGSVFSYATSKWALSCIAMAVILNRTHIFAATRRRLRLRWPIRLLLRIPSLVLLVIQSRGILLSIKCQTAPNFSQLRWGDATKSSEFMFAYPNHLLNSLSGLFLLGYSDEGSCIAAGMTQSQDSNSAHQLRGSLSLLWPLFGTFCLSHFLETVSCAVQGRHTAAETGMTLFEQSLAFAEADAAISNQISWRKFGRPDPSGSKSSNVGAFVALSRTSILSRVNTPPEVLLVAFLSAMTHLTSQILGLFDLQANYRLLSTGFWGICFMGSIVWSAFTLDLEDPSSQSLLRYPTVCIIGFVPHVLVLAGIVTCFIIYGLAILLSALAPQSSGQSEAGMTFRQRVLSAHENMQANMSLSDVRITREMDFYTALLKTGFAAITMASEAVYLNEEMGVGISHHTWLEESRYREAEELQRHLVGIGLSGSRQDHIGAIGMIPVKDGPLIASNGFARERAAQKVPKTRGERNPRVGIGAAERSSRWLMALEFLITIYKLVSRIGALIALWILRAFRIRAQPSWLLWLSRRPKRVRDREAVSASVYGHNSEQVSGPSLSGRAQQQDAMDIEAEFRRVDEGQDEESLERDLYGYWLSGGWWGSRDSSGDYQPEAGDDNWDQTSVISMSSTGGDSDGNDESMGDGWESEESNARTLTRCSPQMSRGATPSDDIPLDLSQLSRLLHPRTIEEREEAETLAAHIRSDRIMTRSSFRRFSHLQRTRILAPSSFDYPVLGPDRSMGRNAKLNPEDEERLLEQLLLSRRRRSTSGDGNRHAAATAPVRDGPQCVVCQCEPRAIIVWPCRCLSLCDDCRVSLAMNNFDKCVCCRRDVMSFSRIYVP